MNKTKVAHRKARNFKTSPEGWVGDLTSATMRANTHRTRSEKKIGSIRHSTPNRPRLNSPYKTRDNHFQSHSDKRELDRAVQRYADLYDLAPTGYVSFNRSGRIEEINLTAAQLFGIARERLIGMPFMVFVAREDTELFLDHLLRCRCSDTRVETELRLKNAAREFIYAQIWSTPVSASLSNGAVLFQTAIVDLTERKRSEEKVQRSEERYRTLFDLVPVAVYTCNAQGLIGEYNHRATELWGQEPGRNGSASKFCGSYKIYYADGQSMPHEKCPMARALRGEKLTSKDLEIIIERPNGERRHVVPSPRVLTNKQGKITGAINCLFDITDHKRAETAAMRLAAVVQSSHDAIAAKTLDGIITDWNKSAERIFGYKSKEIIGKSVLTLIPQYRHPEEEEIQRTIRRGKSLDHFGTVRRRKDGKLIDVSLTISPIKGSKGEIVGISKIARDITKQKQTERRLAEQARLLDLTNEAILVRDSRDRITYWNHGAKELYGYSAEEALGKVTHKLLQTKHSEPLDQIQKKFERAGRWNGELTHTSKDGQKIVVMSHWALDRDELGRRGHVLETNTDITQRKHAEVALQRSRDVLEKLVEKRTRALQIANAELTGEVERRKGLEGEILTISDREQQRLGQELHDGLCQHLTAVAFMARSVALRLTNHRVIDAADIEKIAELVNNAAIDTRNLSRALHRIDVDAAGFVDALRDLVDREIWKIPCRLEGSPLFRIEDDAAAGHLYRIAREAVINANKHAQARQIVIKLERSRQQMILRVTDDGIGVNEEPQLKRGLGFHIMNYRAQLMGGRLEIDSPKNGGTRVSCYLPLPRAGSKKAPTGDRPIWSQGKNSAVPVAGE